MSENGCDLNGSLLMILIPIKCFQHLHYIIAPEPSTIPSIGFVCDHCINTLIMYYYTDYMDNYPYNLGFRILDIPSK